MAIHPFEDRRQENPQALIVGKDLESRTSFPFGLGKELLLLGPQPDQLLGSDGPDPCRCAWREEAPQKLLAIPLWILLLGGILLAARKRRLLRVVDVGLATEGETPGEGEGS